MVTLVQPKFRFLSWSDSHHLMEALELNVLVRLIVKSVLDQFIGSFARANVLSIFKFDAD
jgi:hypothetical protein